MGAGAGISLHGRCGVLSSDGRTPRVGVNSAPIGPCQFEHVIQVVGDAKEFLLSVICGGNGVKQKMRFWSRTDDVAVAVGAVSKHRTGHVRAVAVVVFCIVAAGAQTQ